MTKLLIVESPSKAKTLSKYLGSDFEVLASYGHIRNLLPKSEGINTDSFEMKYALIDRNKKHMDAITKAVKKSDEILLATDPDREGEAIAWHIAEILNEKKLLKDKNEILKPLREVRDSLNLNRGQHIANADLLDLIRRVRCFGINLARLDIRQESSRHQKLVSDVLNKKYKINFSSLSESKKINLLNLLIKQKKYFIF